MPQEEFKRKVSDMAFKYEEEFHGCAQAVLLAFQEALGLKDDLLFRAAGSLVGGMYSGLTCGALTGGLLVIGTRVGRKKMEDGLEGLLESFEPAQRLVKWFKAEYGTTSCQELTGTDWFDINQVMLFLRSPDKLKECTKRVGKTAEKVAEIITEI
jgi:C_GCAxxG_C_C family probable redox protein